MLWQKFSKLVLLGLILPLALSSQTNLFANSSQDRLNELQERTAKLYEDIRKGRQAIKEKQGEAYTIIGQINRLKDDIAHTEAQIAILNDKIATTNQQIDETEKQIAHTQKQLDLELSNQDELIRVVYETLEDDPLFVLASANNLSDLVNYSEYLESLETHIDTVITRVMQIKRDLENQKRQLDAQKQDLAQLKAQQEAYQIGLKAEKQEQSYLLARNETQQKEFARQIEQAKSLVQQVEAEMAAIRRSLSAPGTVRARDRGTSAVGFQWPCDYRYISTYYGGATPFQPNGGHGGLDLVNSAGTPIYAASDGTVTLATEMRYNGRFYAYGKYVVIGHNARWSSLYAHLQTIIVAPGDEVKRGDIIGYMGSTGWSTGPHLHFEIWDYSSRVNPLSYLP